MIGQDRGIEAVRFGIGIRRRGFNIFVFGRSGSGKLSMIQRFLSQHARSRAVPDAWCYVYNFGPDVHDARDPKCLRVPAGCATRLSRGMDQVVEELLVELPGLFEGESFAARRRQVSSSYQRQVGELFDAVAKTSAKRGVTVVQGEDGIGIYPTDDKGEVLSPEEFRARPKKEQDKFRKQMRQTEAELESAMRSARQVRREQREALKELERAMAAKVVATAIDHLKDQCAGVAQVLEHLDLVAADILDQLDLFKPPPEGGEAQSESEGQEGSGSADRPPAAGGTPRARRLADRRLRRYAVNVLVEHDPEAGAPLVVETHPTLANLVGRIEHESRFGAMVTDLTMIQPGALHRANGGYLVIEAEELLKQSYSWDALKRALRNGAVRVEAPTDDGVTTISLDPEPIPLDLKVVLVGEAHLYYLLHAIDGEFPELFKVGAEFGEVMPRTHENTERYARFIAGVANREELLPLEAGAVAAVVDHGARLAEDAERLSTRFLDVTDLLRESDYWAAERGGDAVTRADVAQALAARIRRVDLARELVHEAYEREIILVDTTGEAVGQVNGLTIVSRGQFDFGMPARITARVRMGNGEVVDVEREVELSGPLHSKGVLVISGYVAGRYLPDEPLSMMASITFEQSYAEIEGDSASSAEVYALLSALADVPIRQCLAVTGSVNQMGEVQAIGGVNEKVEGFFDICRKQGLTGEQGVLIPASNVQHLMLRDDVVEAVAAGQFAIFPVRHVDEGLFLLTGMPAGERGEDGEFPADSVNGLVEERLRLLAEKRRELGHGYDDDEDCDSDP